MMIIVSDTSPISNLVLIGQLDLIPKLFGHIIIPPSVYSELLALSDFDVDISLINDANWITVKAVVDTTLVNDLLKILDEGEAEAVALAKELQADYLLIDERKGWKTAKDLNVPTIGIIGILIKCKEKGWITSIMPLVDELRLKAGFWLSESFYKQIKTLVQE